MFTPSHLGSVPPISFGEVFDLPRLRKSLGKPILEWHDVKDQDSESIDEIGCWNTWEAVQEREHYPRRSDVPRLLKLGRFFSTIVDAPMSHPCLYRYIVHKSSGLDQGASAL